MKDNFDDGVFEPGEVFEVRQFSFKNIEKMPTPAKKTYFKLVPGGDLQINGKSLGVSEESLNGIAGNSQQSWNLPEGKYTYKVNDFSPGKGPKPEEFQFLPGVVLGAKTLEMEMGRRFPVTSPGRLVDDSPEMKNLIVVGKGTKAKTLRVINTTKAPYGPNTPVNRRFKIVLRHKDLPYTNTQGTPIASTAAKDVMLTLTGKVPPEVSNATMTLEKEIAFEVPTLAAGADFSFPFEVFVADGVAVPESHFGIEMELYISPAAGEAPTKLIDKDVLTFMSSLNPQETFDAHILVFNRALSCQFPNHTKTSKMIDELWIQKTYAAEKKEFENLNINLKFDHTWWVGSLNDSPTFHLDINQSADFWSAFKAPTDNDAGLKDPLLLRLFQEVIIPQSRAQGTDKSFYVSECSWIDSRRKTAWLRRLNKELVPFRGFGKNFFVLPASW